MLRLTERDVKACPVPSFTFRQGHHQPPGPAGGGAVPPCQDRVGRGRGSQKRHEAPGLGQSHREKGSLRGIRALSLSGTMLRRRRTKVGQGCKRFTLLITRDATICLLQNIAVTETYVLISISQCMQKCGDRTLFCLQTHIQKIAATSFGLLADS